MADSPQRQEERLSETEEIFSTPESEARLDLIRHLIENSELVPLVRGMSGIGKSLLASRLQSSAPKNWVVCHFSADSMMQPERLLAHVARCNGLPDAKDDNIRRLVERFEMLRKRGSVPVLLIDDAQALPPTSLITLLRLYERQVGGAPLVSLVLFADEQIDMLLSTPQLQIMSPQSIQVIDLPPLTRDEANAYMRHLLKQEGLDSRLTLDEARLSRIYRETRGAPGPMGNAILEAVGESGGPHKTAGKKLGGPLVWGAIPVALVLLLMLIFQGPINQQISPQATPAAEGNTPDAPISSEATGVRDVQRHAIAQPAESVPLEKIEAGSAPLPIVTTPGVQPDLVVNESDVSIKQEDMPIELDTEAGTRDAALAMDRREEPSGQSATETPPVEEEVEPAVAASSSVDDQTGVIEASSPPMEAVAPAEAEPMGDVAMPETEQAPAAPSLVRSPSWLAEQIPSHYTIQLLAVENVDSLQQVIANNGLRDEAFSVRTERQGRAWYPLLWGEFPNREAALKAVERLPSNLRKSGVWARSFASLRP